MSFKGTRDLLFFFLILPWKTHSDPLELYLDFAEFIAKGKNSQHFIGGQSYSPLLPPNHTPSFSELLTGKPNKVMYNES